MLFSGGIIILAVLIFVKKKAGLLPSIAPDTSDGNPGISTCIILCLCKESWTWDPSIIFVKKAYLLTDTSCY